MIKSFNRYNESVRDMMRPKSVKDFVKSLSPDMVEIYRRCVDSMWDTDVRIASNPFGGGKRYYPVIHVDFDPFEVYVFNNRLAFSERTHRRKVFAEFHMKVDVGVSNPSGEITGFGDLEDRITDLLINMPLDEGVRDKMTPKTVDGIVDRIRGMEQGDRNMMLYRAVMDGDEELARLLVDNGADPKRIVDNFPGHMEYKLHVGGMRELFWDYVGDKSVFKRFLGGKGWSKKRPL